MAIAISHQAYCELFEEVDQTQQYCDPTDDLDITWKCPKQLAEEWVREIQLREGLSLWVENSRQKFNPWWTTYCGGGQTGCGKDE